MLRSLPSPLMNHPELPIAEEKESVSSFRWSASTWVDREALLTRLWVRGRTVLIQTRPCEGAPPISTIDGAGRPTVELHHECCPVATAGYAPASHFLLQHHQEILEGVLDGRLFAP